MVFAFAQILDHVRRVWIQKSTTCQPKYAVKIISKFRPIENVASQQSTGSHE